MPLIGRSRPPPDPVAPALPSDTLKRWRERILHVTAVTLAVLAGVAYVPGVIAALESGLWPIVVGNTLAWLLIAGVALGRRVLTYRVRANLFLATWFLLSVVLLVFVGPLGGGGVWLMGFPIVAAILLGGRGGGAALGLTVLTILGFGFLVQRGYEVMVTGLDPASYTPMAWAATGSSLFLLSALLSFSVLYLVRSLERALEVTTLARARVSRANKRLRGEIRRREELQHQLVEARKMEALGTLAGGIAHDFNNLLTPILLETEEVRGRLPVGSPERDTLRGVLVSAERGRDLVRRILALSRGAEHERAPALLEPVLREVVGLLQSSVPVGVRVELELEGPEVRVVADPAELHQVFMNLATNGCLAMRDGGGVLTIAAGRDLTEGADGAIEVRVRDTGVGMSPVVLDRVWDPFFTTRGPGGGTGLGLPTVHRIVSDLGGTVSIRSTPGEGTEVVVRLNEAREATTASPVPAAHTHPPGHSEPPDREPSEKDSALTEPALKAKGAPTDAAPCPGPGGTARDPAAPAILIVDDDLALLKATGAVLSRSGYLVTTASNPESALERVAEAPLAWDLVVTDQAMPRMTGLELLQAIRELRAGLPVLLISGYLDAHAMARAVELGVSGVLEKPFDRKALELAVSGILGGRSLGGEVAAPAAGATAPTADGDHPEGDHPNGGALS